MLIQFSVENFLSFKTKAVFSLLATGDDAHPDHIISTNKRKKLLRSAAVYGANASGKSNLIKAMDFARNLILGGTEPDESISVTQYKLGGADEQQSSFQFIFTYLNVEYSYGFKLNRSYVSEEFLYATLNTREVKYFERMTSDELETVVDFGLALKRGPRNKHEFLKYKAADTRPNQLLLTAIFEGNLKYWVEELKPVVDWFRNVLTIIGAESHYRALEVRTHNTEALKDFIGTFLRGGDTGIQTVLTTETVLDWDRDLPNVPARLREELLQQFRRLSISKSDTPNIITALEMVGPHEDRFIVRQNEQGEILLIKLIFKHSGEDGKLVDFQMDEESDGTKRLINIVPTLFDMNEGKAKVIVIDELDRRLHPHLTRLVVSTALQCQHKSQLLFTTHDTNLLDLELLRRDEIWFVEKDESGSSHLYSLAEFKVRPDLQLRKGYLNGRFGAIPFVSDISTLGWTDNSIKEMKDILNAG